MTNYICPRCKGTDIYFTKRQKLQEQGLRLGAQMVNTPVCRGCGEVADKVPETLQELKSSPMTWVGLISIIVIIGILISLF